MWLTRMHLVQPPKPTYRVLAHADTHTCSHTWAAWSPPQKSGWHHHGTDVLVPPLRVPNYHLILYYVCVVRVWFHACYHHSRKYVMLMRLTLLHQPKHAVELTRVHSKPQSGSRFWLDTRPANRQPPIATYYECVGHSNVLKNSVKIPCGELILNYFIKRRPIILGPAQGMPGPPQDGGSQTDGRPATDGESRRRVRACVHAQKVNGVCTQARGRIHTVPKVCMLCTCCCAKRVPCMDCSK